MSNYSAHHHHDADAAFHSHLDAEDDHASLPMVPINGSSSNAGAPSNSQFSSLITHEHSDDGRSLHHSLTSTSKPIQPASGPVSGQVHKCLQWWEVQSKRNKATYCSFFLLISFAILLLCYLYLQPAPPPTQYVPTPASLRLPTNVIPSAYHIDLFTNMSLSQHTLPTSKNTFPYWGVETIQLQVLNETDSIVLHSVGLTVWNVSLTHTSLGVLTPTSITFSNTNDNFLTFTFPQKLSAPREYNLTFYFSAVLRDDLRGFYLSTYTSGTTEEHLAITQFEAVSARYAFPCFDEPQLKATFTFTMTTQSEYVALFNMPLLTTNDHIQVKYNDTNIYNSMTTNGWSQHTFQTSARMSTYLVAFGIMKYSSLQSSYISKLPSSSPGVPAGQNVTVSVWSDHSVLARGRVALDAAVRIMAYFEDFFSTPYPLPKQDLLAIPDFAAGAMENWGLITYRETALLYDDTQPNDDDLQRVIIVVAHELAHQWFGNIVTMRWWSDLWLNEGFASFVEYLGTGFLYPTWDMQSQFVTTSRHNALVLDASMHSHPIVAQVSDPNEIDELFDDISYEKGATLIRMMQDFLGDAVFKQGLANYLHTYAYSNAASTDLFNQLTLASNNAVNVTQVMAFWTTQMGFPLITIQYDSTTNTLTVTQRRYVETPSSDTSSSSTSSKWPIYLTWQSPINSSTTVMQSHSLWFDESTDQLTISLPSAQVRWIQFNPLGKGMYRVNYPVELWSRLITALNTQAPDHFPSFTISDRCTLLDDAFALSIQNDILLSYDKVVLSLLKPIGRTDNAYDVWKTILIYLNRLTNLLVQTTSTTTTTSGGTTVSVNNTVVDLVNTYYKGLLSRQITRFSTATSPWGDTGDHTSNMLQSMILLEAIKLRDAATSTWALQQFYTWYNSSAQGQPKTANNTIYPGVRDAVYRMAIEHEDDQNKQAAAAAAGVHPLWDFLWSEYLSGVNGRTLIPLTANEKRRLLHGLAATTNVTLLSKLLHASLDSTLIRSQDTATMIAYVSRNVVGKQLAWQFVTDKTTWQTLVDRFGSGSFTFTSLINTLTNEFASQAEYDMLKDFGEFRDFGGAERAYQRALERTKVQMNWAASQKDNLIQALKNHATDFN